MPDSMRYQKAEVQERIARDYVIGTLSAAARRRCDALRAELPELDARIHQWSDRLQPMADEVPELEPQPALWRQIEASINAEANTARGGVADSASEAWWNRLSLLRGFALASSFALLAFVTLQVTEPPAPQLDYVAVLATEGGQARFVATASEADKSLNLRNVGDAVPADATWQLWALSRTDGEPRSLGLIRDRLGEPQALDESDWRLIADARELLITAEMAGGSPIGEPSDEIVSRGLCVRLTAS